MAGPQNGRLLVMNETNPRLYLSPWCQAWPRGRRIGPRGPGSDPPRPPCLGASSPLTAALALGLWASGSSGSRTACLLYVTSLSQRSSIRVGRKRNTNCARIPIPREMENLKLQLSPSFWFIPTVSVTCSQTSLYLLKTGWSR